MYTIEKNVIPPTRAPRGFWADLLQKLEVGDGFEIEEDKVANARAAVQTFKKRVGQEEKKFSVGKNTESKVVLVRIL